MLRTVTRCSMVAAAALAIAAGVPAAAQTNNALAVVRAADAKLYYAQEHGLRDVRADIEIEAKGEGTEITRLRYLWKMPGCERWMSLGDHPAVVESPNFFDVWAVEIVRRPLVEAFAGCQDMSAREVGGDTVVSGSRSVGSVTEQIELTVSKGLPSKLARTLGNKMIAITDLRYDKRGGGLVPSRFKMEVREGEDTAELEVDLVHKQIRTFWLPETITIKAGRDSARLTLGNCQTNTGLPELKCEPLEPPPAP
jgi:hypothetical protein